MQEGLCDCPVFILAVGGALAKDKGADGGRSRGTKLEVQIPAAAERI